MVGTPRFELGTLCSQSRCASQLRYVPKTVNPNRRKGYVKVFEMIKLLKKWVLSIVGFIFISVVTVNVCLYVPASKDFIKKQVLAKTGFDSSWSKIIMIPGVGVWGKDFMVKADKDEYSLDLMMREHTLPQ